jgi:uncharacterized membrane protein (DUF373 family)
LKISPSIIILFPQRLQVCHSTSSDHFLSHTLYTREHPFSSSKEDAQGKGEMFVSEHLIGNTSEEKSNADHTPDQRKDNHIIEDRLAFITSNLLDRGDSIIYAIVGTCFFLGGFIALGYSFWDFGYHLVEVSPLTPSVVANAIVQFISDLLLVLIIMEVLGTVIHYLKSHATSLRPFLFIGIISATRGILSIGARLSIESESARATDFTSNMIELGVSAAVIVALGITVRLLGRYSEE